MNNYNQKKNQNNIGRDKFYEIYKDNRHYFS